MNPADLMLPNPAVLVLLGCLVAARWLRLSQVARARVLALPLVACHRRASLLLLALSRAGLVLAARLARLPRVLATLALPLVWLGLLVLDLVLAIPPVMAVGVAKLLKPADWPDTRWDLLEVGARIWAIRRLLREERAEVLALAWRRKRP